MNRKGPGCCGMFLWFCIGLAPAALLPVGGAVAVYVAVV